MPNLLTRLNLKLKKLYCYLQLRKLGYGHTKSLKLATTLTENAWKDL